MSFKVLIAIDGSENAQYAFEWYLKHTHRTGNEVVLAHVAEVAVHPKFGFRPGLGVPKEEWEKMVKEHEDSVKGLKEKYGKLLKSKGIKYTFRSENGEAGHHVCDIAKKDGVNLVVMGTRGQGILRRTILGSVSDYALHHTHVPIIICHPPSGGD